MELEEAIGKFLDGLEGQDSEGRGFEEIHRFLATLSVPAAIESREMTHAEALEGKIYAHRTHHVQACPRFQEYRSIYMYSKSIY